MKVKNIIKKVIGIFFEEEPETNKRKNPFEDNPNVDYKGVFCWEDEMTLGELLEQETIIRRVCIYEG